jgi:clan AA aspartic protease
VTGIVVNREPRVRVALHSASTPGLAIEFVVDTGFAGDLTLPETAVIALGFTFRRRIDANLADDSVVPMDLYEADITWEGKTRRVGVLATGARPLLGTALLDGHDLTIRFAQGGGVTVAPIPTESGAAT